MVFTKRFNDGVCGTFDMKMDHKNSTTQQTTRGVDQLGGQVKYAETIIGAYSTCLQVARRTKPGINQVFKVCSDSKFLDVQEWCKYDRLTGVNNHTSGIIGLDARGPADGVKSHVTNIGEFPVG